MWAPAVEGRLQPPSRHRRAGLPGRGRQLCDARPVFARLDGSVLLPASTGLSLPASKIPCSWSHRPVRMLPPPPSSVKMRGRVRLQRKEIKTLPPSRYAKGLVLGLKITPGVLAWGMSLSPRQRGPARPRMDLQARDMLLSPSGCCCCGGERGKRFGAWWLFILLNVGNGCNCAMSCEAWHCFPSPEGLRGE